MEKMEATTVVIKEKVQQVGGFKVIKKGNIIESYNNLNQVFHFVDLSYVQAGILYHGWVGFRSNEQLKEIMDGHLLDILKGNRCQNMLLDTSRMSGSFSETNDWCATYYMPKLKSAGLKNIAAVLPKDIFAQLAMKDWLKGAASKGFNSAGFVSLADGINWLAIQ